MGPEGILDRTSGGVPDVNRGVGLSRKYTGMPIGKFTGRTNQLRALHAKSIQRGKEMLGTCQHLMPNARGMLSLYGASTISTKRERG